MKNRYIIKCIMLIKYVLSTIGFSLWFIHSVVVGAGFEATQTSGAGLGYSFAGRATSIEDSSFVYNNPAAMTLRKNQSVSAALHLIDAKISFKNKGSTAVSGRPLMGGNGSSNKQSVIPNLYLHTIVKGIHIGFAVNAPFASKTDYGTTWVGRYHASQNLIKTINYNLATAYQFTPKLRVGVGISYQTLEADLQKAVDVGTIAAGAASRSTRTAGLAPTLATAKDGKSTVKGDSAAIGYNFGVLYDINRYSRVGFTYRSQMVQDITNAKANFSIPDATNDIRNNRFALSFFNGVRAGLSNTKAKTKNTLPAQANLGLRQGLTPQATLYTDLTWTGWSSIKSLTIDFDDIPDAVTTFKFKDSFRWSVGAGYTLNDQTLLRFGFAYDQSSVDKAENRTPTLPDTDRIWLSLGAQHKFSSAIGVDVGYAYVTAIDDANDDANSNKVLEGSVKHTLKGKYGLTASLFGAQLNWAF